MASMVTTEKSAVQAIRLGGRPFQQRECTLLELVQAVSDVTRDEREVVQTVLHMLETGRVRLRGILRSVPFRRF